MKMKAEALWSEQSAEESTMERLKVGFVGAGGIMGVHAPILSKHPDVELVGVADVFAPAAEKFAQTYDVPFQTQDFRDLIERVDAVLIGIPTHLHSAAAVEFLKAGKAVFCEKPLARTIEQADAILSAAQQSGAPLQVGFVRRFDAEWLAWCQAVQQERVGRPVMWRDVQAHSGAPSAWYYVDEQGGGPFLDGCIHNIDFSLKTFGPAQWAFCHARSFKNSSALDSGSATIRFKSGDEMLLAWSWGLPKDVSGSTVFEIIGPRGVISFPRDDAKEPSFIVSTAEHRERVGFPANALMTGFEAQMDEFIHVARGQAQPRAGGAQGREALHLALAILESGRTQQVVQVGN